MKNLHANEKLRRYKTCRLIGTAEILGDLKRANHKVESTLEESALRRWQRVMGD
jgi:hypothetical protein